MIEDSSAQPVGRRSWLRGRALGIDILAVIASGAATGLLGFVFWTVAARGYSTAEVGRASAIISSAALTATLATLSLGSLYERFLPLSGNTTRRFIGSGISLILLTAGLFGTLFVLLGPRTHLFHGLPEMLLFPVAVMILAIFAVQDQILIGLGRTRTILTKNVGQSTAKLAAVAALIPLATGSAIVWAWVVPAAVIAAVVAVRVITPVSRRHDGPTDLPPRKDLFHFFVSSYAINSVLVVVPLVVPLIIVARLGTEMNAYFSMCWLVVNTVGVLLGATAAPFVATASAPGADLRACTLRFTVMCGGAAVLGCLGLLAFGPLVLRIMGAEYAEEAGHLIRLMALTLPSLAMLHIYGAMARLRRKLKLAVAVQLLSGCLIITGVAVTTPMWGIDAVGYTYLATELACTVIIAIPTVRLVRRALQHTAAVPTPEPADVDDTTSSAERPLEFDSVTAQFAAVAAARPDAVAVCTATDTITYGELDAAARRWAARLDAPGRHATLLSASLSPGTVAAVLGVFASNSVLVALDPGLPANRVQAVAAMLSRHDWRIDTLITDSPTGELPAVLGRRCRLEATDLPSSSAPALPAPHPAGTGDVTSIQFTSGSSGVPKAVLHPNGMWLCDAQMMSDRFGIRAGRRIALCMPISFGAGLNVLTGSLLGGAEVIAIDPRTETPRAAFERIGDSGAHILVSTPAFLDALCGAAAGDQLPAVERIVTTGEAAHSRHVHRARVVAPHAVFTNWVGSSETSSIANHDIAPGATVPGGAIAAGAPSPHKQIALDTDGTVTITSPYLALGYLDGTRSPSRFTDNPDGTRTFRGGDLGRWDDDGCLILLGRADAAVKIRGYLVEPAEVEATLLSYPEVCEAVVVASPKTAAGENDSPELTAYLAPAPDCRTPALADLRARLHRDLPAWMVPANLVMLPALPRTGRGKVDRQALPPPTRPVSAPPHAGLESAIAEVWADVLRMTEVGRTENFYALGGDSLSVTQMLSRIGDQHGVRLSHADLASSPTVAQFAEALTKRGSDRVSRRRPRLAPTTVPIRSADGAPGPMLFCFAGAGASALSFVPLADHLGAGTAVYAFIANGLENRGVPDWTVARAARRHLTDLRRLQPQGPYLLVGHSLGCYIALEVARMLESDGQTVEFVTLLDPILPPATARAARRDDADATPVVESPPLGRLELWRRRLLIPLAGLIQFRGHRQAQALEEVGVRVGRMHRPAPWHGRTLLILSHLNPDRDALWTRLLTGELTVEILRCDHNSIVRPPYVAMVVDLMSTRSRPADSMSVGDA